MRQSGDFVAQLLRNSRAFLNQSGLTHELKFSRPIKRLHKRSHRLLGFLGFAVLRTFPPRELPMLLFYRWTVNTAPLGDATPPMVATIGQLPWRRLNARSRSSRQKLCADNMCEWRVGDGVEM